MKEIWKPIKEFDKYEVSNFGRVRNSKKHILKPIMQINGYYNVCLTKNKKQYHKTIHKLVAETFLPDKSHFKILPEEDPNIINQSKLQVNHKDEDKTNNHISNLEWCTAQYNTHFSNQLHSDRIPFPKSKRVVCIETGTVYTSGRHAEKCTGVDNSLINKVCKGKRKSAGGYHWKFI